MPGQKKSRKAAHAMSWRDRQATRRARKEGRYQTPRTPLPERVDLEEQLDLEVCEDSCTRAEGCDVCQVFRCTAPQHIGDRATPWDRGHVPDALDVEGTWCDDCWFVDYMSVGPRVYELMEDASW